MPLGHPKNHRVFGCFSLISHGSESKGDMASKRPAKGELVNPTHPSPEPPVPTMSLISPFFNHSRPSQLQPN